MASEKQLSPVQRGSCHEKPLPARHPVAKKLKVLLYGPSGCGKTTAALTFPRCAVIDTEGGTDLYAGRPGIAPFHGLRVKTASEVEQALTFIEQDRGKTFDTLVIDPVTVIYDVAKAAAERASKNGDMSYREWASVNNKMKALYTRLTNLPVHVVATAREAVEYEGSGTSLRKVGVKPDADKALVYVFDFVVRLTADREAESLADKAVAQAFYDHWAGQGLTSADMCKALDVERFGQWTNGRAAADKAVADWLQAQLAKPATPAPVAEAPSPLEGEGLG
ncbi:MAG: ATP-binding protein [Chloroflexi bacterium]|nr:ATP-binding protein [Chloroflexota bacterium]